MQYNGQKEPEETTCNLIKFSAHRGVNLQQTFHPLPLSDVVLLSLNLSFFSSKQPCVKFNR